MTIICSNRYQTVGDYESFTFLGSSWIGDRYFVIKLWKNLDSDSGNLPIRPVPAIIKAMYRLWHPGLSFIWTHSSYLHG